MNARALGLASTLLVLLSSHAIAQAPTAPTTLTLDEAERRALQNHPQLQATQYSSAAAKEVVRETRSAYFPTVFGSVTGASALDGSRITAGGLNNPIIYDRFATGVSVGQLVTDFGRTRAIVRSSSLNADARAQDVDDERAIVLLEVDRAYYGILRAQAVERVSQATVDARRLVVDQVTALAQSNLRSGLDVSFATVNLSAAQLQLVQAQNETQRAFTAMAVALGESSVAQYAVADQPLPSQPPSDSAPLLADALRQRPDVLAARLTAESANAFAEAEGDLWRPSVAAVGAAGVTPYHQTGIEDRYAAAAVNVNVPILNGSLFSARHAEASLRARAVSERLRDLENRVRQDVQVAWLDARTAFQRLDLTRQLSEQAGSALDLAQARYDLGLGSIVELSQAQLNKTQADLEGASATYDYQVEMALLAHAIGSRK
jgi:outer membrane protein